MLICMGDDAAGDLSPVLAASLFGRGDLFGDHVAPRRHDLAPDAVAHDRVDALGDARLLLHQNVKIRCVEH